MTQKQLTDNVFDRVLFVTEIAPYRRDLLKMHQNYYKKALQYVGTAGAVPRRYGGFFVDQKDVGKAPLHLLGNLKLFGAYRPEIGRDSKIVFL
jgi:hypothetical protein